MAKSFKTLRDKMTPERRKKNEESAYQMLGDLALQELRKSLDLTQEQVADIMKLHQAGISKIEGQADIYVSTLRKYISALGGQLKLVASFPDREVVITQFDSVNSAKQ